MEDADPLFKLSEVIGFQVQAAPGQHIGPGLGPYAFFGDPNIDEAQLRVVTSNEKSAEALAAVKKLRDELDDAIKAARKMNIEFVFLKKATAR
jgi:hypothetical protein